MVFMRKIIVFLTLAIIMSSCVGIGFELVNEKGMCYDKNGDVTVLICDTLHDKVWLDFRIESDDDIGKYNSSRRRLKYGFTILYPILPNVELNSFSYTTKSGDTLPSILYYRTDGKVAHVIEKLPMVFTNDIHKRKMKLRPFCIYAECSQSYASIRTVYINYDITVGDKHFAGTSKYRKKLYLDVRPKFY